MVVDGSSEAAPSAPPLSTFEVAKVESAPDAVEIDSVRFSAWDRQLGTVLEFYRRNGVCYWRASSWELATRDAVTTLSLIVSDVEGWASQQVAFARRH